MGGVLRGDFGESISQRRPVLEVVAEKIPATLQLGGAAFMLALIVGIPLGVSCRRSCGAAFWTKSGGLWP